MLPDEITLVHSDLDATVVSESIAQMSRSSSGKMLLDKFQFLTHRKIFPSYMSAQLCPSCLILKNWEKLSACLIFSNFFEEKEEHYFSMKEVRLTSPQFL